MYHHATRRSMRIHRRENDMDTVHKKAQALINAIHNAITEGVKHYDIHGKPLTTIKSVITALNRDRKVEIVPPGHISITQKPDKS